MEFGVGSKGSRAGSKGAEEEEEAQRHSQQLEEEEQYPVYRIFDAFLPLPLQIYS
jgi:hypothetical protein